LEILFLHDFELFEVILKQHNQKNHIIYYF